VPPASPRRGTCHRGDASRTIPYLDPRPLGPVPPAEVYQASLRTLPSRLRAPEYPGHWEVRRVLPNGGFRWRSDFVSLSSVTVMVGHDIGLEEDDDGLWSLDFGMMPIGRFDESARPVPDTHERPLDPAASATPWVLEGRLWRRPRLGLSPMSLELPVLSRWPLSLTVTVLLAVVGLASLWPCCRGV
jgi:hypothetical protein